MHRLQQTIILIILSLSTIFLNAQNDFFLNGSAIATSENCYQLTETVNWQVGSIWNEEKINLTESFEVVVDLFFGCADSQGADGLVFGLQPISTSIGTGGGDLGFGDVSPSLGVEFDTFQNLDFDDPTFDHIAIIKDGTVRHNLPDGALAGPILANATNANIEDCEYHSTRIIWDADSLTLSVYLDCNLRLSYTGDIVNEIFGGDPLVFWGFTSATGGLNNVHEICFSYTSIIDGLTDETICLGTETQLVAGNGVSHQWSPAEGLSDTNIANPIASPDVTTLYTVEIIDDCGNSFFDDVLITVENNQFEVEVIADPNNPTEIFPNSELAYSLNVTPNGNYTYAWSSAIGSTFSNPDSANTIVFGSINQVGTEMLTVEVISEDGCTELVIIEFPIGGSVFQIPNAFTPDQDGVNDFFGVITEAELIGYNCKIFNRWGQIVFESNNQSEVWDGNFKDKAAPSDVYVYLIGLEVGGNRIVESGDVTLIR